MIVPKARDTGGYALLQRAWIRVAHARRGQQGIQPRTAIQCMSIRLVFFFHNDCEYIFVHGANFNAFVDAAARAVDAFQDAVNDVQRSDTVASQGQTHAHHAAVLCTCVRMFCMDILHSHERNILFVARTYVHSSTCDFTTTFRNGKTNSMLHRLARPAHTCTSFMCVHHIVALDHTLTPSQYPSPAEFKAACDELLALLGTIPSVTEEVVVS